MPRHTDTIAALATPVGTSALAVLRVSGPDTQRLVGELAGRELPPRVATLLDYRDRAGALLDEVLATRFVAPRSYTGEDSLEISCHGSPFIAQKILEDLYARGCRSAEPGEFTQRAFLNGRMDLSQAEAVMDVIHARSERALAAAQDQLRGALGRHINQLTNRLLGTLARVEAYIDFPDEDLPPEDRDFIGREIAALAGATQQLLATNRYGEILRDGIRTVIVGAPNVGKSSLLNRLLGRDRALVSPEPGTTRDFLEERVVVGPHALRLVDTAGFNASPTPLEKQGMDKARDQIAEAHLIINVTDIVSMEYALSEGICREMLAAPTLRVLNKIDLLPNGRRSPAPPESEPILAVSALTGVGIEELRRAIVTLADSFQRTVGEEQIAIGARHAQALASARAALATAEARLAEGATELLASDLRSALAGYGEIVGRIDNERMLDRLFATFCIGK